MNRILIMTAIIVLTVAIISSSFLTNVLAKKKVTRGPIECRVDQDPDTKEYTGTITCCQKETDSEGIEITRCTVCDDTSPPSNCTTPWETFKSLPSDLPSVEQNPTVSPPRDHPPLATDNLEKQPSSENTQLIGKSGLEENINKDNNPNNQYLKSDDNNKENDLDETVTPKETSTQN